MMTTTDDFISNNAKERSASANFVVMVCRRGDNFIFLLLRVFLFKFSSFSKAITRATHYMTASSKTHKSAQPRC